MTRKERMLAAIRHQSVDRVPYATYGMHPYAGGHCHASDPSYAGLLQTVRASAGVAAKSGTQEIGVAFSRAKEGVQDVRIEGQGDDRVRRTTIHTPKGDLETIAHIPENKPARTVQHLVSTDADLDAFMSLPYDPPDFDLSKPKAFIETARDRGLLLLCYDEPMYSTARLWGEEQFLIRCVTDLRTIKRTVDWFFERCVENMRRLTQACRGMDCVLHTLGPEICTPPMLSPRYFTELVTPYLRELIAIIHDAGLLAGLHCHGRVREVLPEIIRTDVDFLEPIEPPDQGNITLEELMTQAEGRLCLMGYIQDQEFYTVPPGTMTRRVESIARVVNGRTGYIMSPTCTPFQHPCSDVYKRNYAEWLEAAGRILG